MSIDLVPAKHRDTIDTVSQTNSTSALAQVEHLTKRFGRGPLSVTALTDVSLEVPPGEFLAIMGASGSGKSTLLHLLAGLTGADAGRVIVAGAELSGMTDAELTRFRRRHIGLVFQAFNLIPSLTAEENILLPLRAAGATLKATRLDEMLERLRLEGRRGHRPDALSGGEQQRVAIARALITDPSLVLADEPTGSLDSATGQQVCQLLRELNEQEQRTIVVVTHEPAVAQWADRVVVLKDGAVLTQFGQTHYSDALTLSAQYQAAIGEATPTGAQS